MKSKLPWRQILRFVFALVALFCCYQLIVFSARAGYSRLLSTVAIIQPNIEPADKAVRLTPNDPEAHYTRALSLVNKQRLGEAVRELQEAIRLRPHHYYQWLDLGVTLQRLEKDSEGAAALKESIRLAPSFAQPHWQLGSLLYREERFDDAFQELRLGAKSNPNLVSAMLDLAWVAAAEDVVRFESLIQPDSARGHLEMAEFLARQGKGTESVKHARAGGFPHDEEELSLLRRTISDLLSSGNAEEAFETWLLSHPNSRGSKGQIVNGSFVEAILANDPGFGWQILRPANVAISIDLAGPTANMRSLRIEFSGDSQNQIFYQRVLLSPNSHYSLSFSAKAEKLVSGGPPVVAALDTSSSPVILGQSKPLSPGSDDWTSYVVAFSTREKGSNVMISLQRAPCSPSPCPVFGKLWLSGFSLTKG